MSGTVKGGTPWTRQALRRMDPDHLARIEAAIPDGQHITLIVHNGRYGAWGALMGHVRTDYGRSTPEAACWAVLNAAREAVSA